MTKKTDWITTKELASALGCTQAHIRRNLKDSVLKEGHHYRNISPHAWRPSYRWHLPRCQAGLKMAQNAQLSHTQNPDSLVERNR